MLSSQNILLLDGFQSLTPACVYILRLTEVKSNGKVNLRVRIWNSGLKDRMVNRQQAEVPATPLPFRHQALAASSLRSEPSTIKAQPCHQGP